MRLKIVTGITLFFLVFICSDTILIIFKNILGHAISSSSVSDIFVYKLSISALYALCAVVVSVAVSSGLISSLKNNTYFAVLAATIVFTTCWLLFRLFILKSYLHYEPTAMPASFSISIDILNKIIVNAILLILSLLSLAFGYKLFTHRRKVN